MTQWLTLSRAARLIGVPRGALQRHVREGRLPSNDGLVSTEGLARLYPAWSAEDSGAFERVSRLKEEAFGRRVQERVLPPQDVLAQRLFEQSRELADARRHLARYHALVVALQERLDALAAGAASPAIDALRASLGRGLADVLATESADALTVMNDVLKVMSAQVTVRPSGRVYFVEGRDSLLQAGLKAGLKLAYGCGNGTCGLCKARVIEGQVVRTMPFDYPLSEAERMQGHTLLCAHSAASGEIVIETLEARGPDEIPEQEIAVRVRAVQPLAGDTLLLHLQTPRTSRLRFLAGQSVTLYAGAGGGDAHATYPIASCPCDDRNLHFHVGRDAGDALAEMLHTGAIRPGRHAAIVGADGALRARGVRASVGVRRLRHRIRAGQEPHRARDGHRGDRIHLARLARAPCGRTLPGEPVPCLGRSARRVPLCPAPGGRPRRRRPRGGDGHGAVDRAASARHLRRRSGGVRRGRGCRAGRGGRVAGTALRDRRVMAMDGRRIVPIVPAASVAEGDCAGAEPFALMVLGDSMAPEFSDGDVIVVEPEGLAGDGAYVVAEVHDGWTLRQLARAGNGWQLRALNAAYPATAIADLATVRGVVIQKSRPGRRSMLKRYID